MFKKVKKKELKVPADIGNLGEMRDFITKVGRKYGVSENIINAFKMAIDEAGTNIIRHAYRDWEGFITVRMIIREQNVTVSLIDQGKTFDPRKVKNPDLDRYVNIGKKGGLGIFIMRKVIDEIDYRKTVEGNELRLTKIRELDVSKKFSIPELSFSMKTRYSLIASGILTFLILIFSIWNYIYQGKKVFNTYLEEGQKLASTVVQNSAEFLANEETWELARISAELQHNHTPLVSEIIIVDSTGSIQGAVNMENLLKPFSLPRKYRKKSDSLYVYDYAGVGSVYDINKPAEFEIDDNRYILGSVHIMLNKSFVDGNVAQKRKSIFWRSLVILVSGCIGVFVLVYTTMSPFKKLSHWVKALGRGEAEDVMEFDNSDEVGEIAQAFNDITEKFRETQEHLAEQERLQKEVQVAQDIQQTLLPASFPDIEGYEISTYYEAAKEVGGDYFDFVEVDNDTLGIVVADVSGKGVPGSLVMTMIRTALRTEARGNKNAADVLAKVNSFVMKDMKRGMFVTIFYVILDSKKRSINYASAGHNPMILYRGSTKKSYYLNPKGFPIGIKLPDDSLFNKTIESDTLHLRPEDSLIVYTDGITEAMNHNRERFGDERFLSVIREYGDLNVEPFVNKIRDEIIIFSEGFAQTDDITLVAIREKLKAEDVLFNHRLRLMKLVDKKGLSVKEACKRENVSTSTYYKYRKKYNKKGKEGLYDGRKITKIEDKHISIEDRAKIIDIIKNNPDYGAKRISEELKSDKYDNVEIDEKRIYDELVKSKLNTKELRLAFIEKGGRKALKKPGTPFVTLDGKIVNKPTIVEQSVDVEDEDRKVIKEEEKDFEEVISEEPEEVISEHESEIHEKTDHILNDFIGSSEDEDIITPESEEEAPAESLEEKEEQKQDIVKEIPQESEEEIDELEEIEETLDHKDIYYSDVFDEQDVEEEIASFTADELLDEEQHEDIEYGKDKQEEEETSFLKMSEGLDVQKRKRVPEEKKPNPEEEKRIREKRIQRFLKSGKWFYKQGSYEKAIIAIKKVLNEDPTNLNALHYLGDAYFKIGNLDKSEYYYDKVRRVQPDNLTVAENLGVIYANRGEYKKAVFQWNEVLKRTPERRDLFERIKRMQQTLRKQVL